MKNNKGYDYTECKVTGYDALRQCYILSVLNTDTMEYDTAARVYDGGEKKGTIDVIFSGPDSVSALRSKMEMLLENMDYLNLPDAVHDLILIIKPDEKYHVEKSYVMTRKDFNMRYFARNKLYDKKQSILKMESLLRTKDMDGEFLKIETPKGYITAKTAKDITELMHFLDGDYTQDGYTHYFAPEECNTKAQLLITKLGFKPPECNYPYPMPDESITLQDMYDCGYYYEDALPLREEAAKKLSELNRPNGILMLYSVQPENGDTLFLIAKEDWEAFLNTSKDASALYPPKDAPGMEDIELE